MRFIKEEEASYKNCPFKFNEKIHWTCDTHNCMAWEFDTTWPDKKEGRCLLMEGKE